MPKRKITDEREIDKIIDKWREGTDRQKASVWQALGWTKMEYATWVETGEIPRG